MGVRVQTSGAGPQPGEVRLQGNSAPDPPLVFRPRSTSGSPAPGSTAVIGGRCLTFCERGGGALPWLRVDATDADGRFVRSFSSSELLSSRRWFCGSRWVRHPNQHRAFSPCPVGCIQRDESEARHPPTRWISGQLTQLEMCAPSSHKNLECLFLFNHGEPRKTVSQTRAGLSQSANGLPYDVTICDDVVVTAAIL